MPRAYDMSKRALAREETRQRIVDATVRLHGEHGVLGTAWKDIAAEADVSVATVYKHFPSLSELLPACGEVVMERVRPPRVEDAKSILLDAAGIEERLTRASDELFAFYERGGSLIEVDVRERKLKEMQGWEEYLRELVSTRARAAIGRGHSAHTTKLVESLFDLSTYRSFSSRGLPVGDVVDAVVTMALAVLDVKPRNQGAKSNA